MKKLFLVFILVFFSAIFAYADVLIRQETNTPAMMGQPASSEIMEVWLGDGQLASIGKESGMIINTNTNKVYIINHIAKNYVESDLPLDMNKLLGPEMAPMMKQMMDSITVAVEKVDKPKKILDIDTDAYDVKMTMMGMPMNMTYWVAEKGLPFNWDDYRDIYMQMAQAQMQGGEKLMEEMSKVKGFPLGYEMEVMGSTITSYVIEINPKASPEKGIYSIPENYTKTETLGGM